MDADVVVVGAGVIGCAVARALAPDRDVLVLDRGQVAAAATALAAGEVTMTPSYSDLPAVAEHANAFFRAYDGHRSFAYHERPSLELVTSGRGEVARRRVDRLRGEGVPVDFLDPEAVAETYPRFAADAIDGAVRHEETGFLDPYTLATTLRADAEEAGATFRTETTVERVVTANGAVRGVATAGEDVRADTVVAAAGWRTERLLRGTCQVPVRPYRTQCLVLEPADALDELFPMGWIPGEHVYFRPELNGDLLVGGWSFAESDPENASRQEDEAFRDHVADLLPRFFAGVDRAGVVDGWAGVDGATPDTRPIIDAPADGPEGLVVATGFHGRGVMTAPVAAALVREVVVGDDDHDLPPEPFALSRFDSRSPAFEFHSISSGDDDYADYD